jgi:peptidoglycan/LPS O-acetylase OafA/YrhL
LEARPDRHLPALDGVRGLAILAVLLFHFVAQMTPTNAGERIVTAVFNYGSLGVDLFFVLSGFLITGILYDSRDEPSYFKSFYMRRVLRIFPLYYAVLAVVFLVVPLVPALRATGFADLRRHQAWAWLYGINVYLSIQGDWVLSYIEHFWSLAVEEHFYFVWPLVVWLLAPRPRLLLRVALAVAALSFGARLVAALAGTNLVAITVLTPFQLDALCLGGFLAVYVRDREGALASRRAVVPLVVLAGAGLLLQFGVRSLTPVNGSVAATMRGGAFRLLFAAIVLRALFAPPSSAFARFFCSGPMVALGKYSYGLYVYHHFLSCFFLRHGTEFALARALGSHTLAVAIQALGGITVSIGVAWVSYEFFEKPFLRLKRFWPSSREPARTDDPALVRPVAERVSSAEPRG